MNFLNNIGWPELLVIGFILMFFMGGSKLNEFARGLGEAKKEVKKIKSEFETIKKEETSEGGDK